MDEEQKPQQPDDNSEELTSEGAEEPAEQEESEEPEKPSRWHRFINWYKANKKKSIPLTVLALIILIAAVPWSRYHAAGLVLQKNIQLKVIDSTANTAVSGAQVTIGSRTGITDANGEVTLYSVKVGSQKAVVSKKYYQQKTVSVLVPIFKEKTVPAVSFVATGRQVKITVANIINHKKLSNVDIKISGTTAKTDQSGSATVVVPVGTETEKAALSLSGYNDASVTVQADNKTIKENDFTLTPAGKIYFLSKLSGNIDVVKTNLNGTGRQTILAGTGREDDRGTVLLASRDWKYLALLSRRTGLSPSLYLINTANDSVTTIETGAADDFNPVGWSNDNFVYTETKQNVPTWKPKGEALKSYNAATKQLLTLDETRAEGTSDFDYAQEAYGNVYQIGGSVIFEKYWSSNYNSPERLNNKQAV